MRTKFAGHYPPSESHFSELWATSIIALDTNVLLNLYRHSPQGRGDMIDLFKALKGRLWLPFQVAREFHRNRLSVITGQARSYTDLITNLSEALGELEDRYNHPFVSEDLLGQARALFETLQEELKTSKSQLEQSAREDTLLDEVTNIFDGRVGDEFSAEKISEIEKEGAKRYARKIPPGYADEKEKLHSPDGPYGDLIIWKECIAKAKTEKKSLILVCDDEKEDWWWRHAGETFGPRPELIVEFKRECGQNCWVYPSDVFAKRASDYIKTIKPVRETTIKEAKDIRETQGTAGTIVSATGRAEGRSFAMGVAAVLPAYPPRIDANPLSVESPWVSSTPSGMTGAFVPPESRLHRCHNCHQVTVLLNVRECISCHRLLCDRCFRPEYNDGGLCGTCRSTSG